MPVPPVEEYMPARKEPPSHSSETGALFHPARACVVNKAGKPAAMRRSGRRGTTRKAPQVCFNHFLHQFLEGRLVRPAQLIACLGGIADKRVHFCRAVILGVDL